MARRKKSLYPDYLPHVAAALLVAVEAVLAMALIYPPAIGPAIDPASPFQPRPAWYFLWLYQLLRYFPGRLAVFGTAVLPTLFVLAFIFMPYIDRGKNGKKMAIIVGAVLLVVVTLFTIIPVFHY